MSEPPGVECPGLGLDVDNAGGAQAVLRRQRAGDQRHGIGEPRLQRLAEDIDPLRQLNPVEAVLQIGVIAADVDLPERILGNTGSLQQQLVQRLIVALRLGFDRLPAEIVDGGAEAGLDLLAGDIELLGDYVEIERNPSFGGWPFPALPPRRRRSRRECKGKTGGTRRVPAQTGLAIEFLFLIWSRAAAVPRRSVS